MPCTRHHCFVVARACRHSHRLYRKIKTRLQNFRKCKVLLKFSRFSRYRCLCWRELLSFKFHSIEVAASTTLWLVGRSKCDTVDWVRGKTRLIADTSSQLSEIPPPPFPRDDDFTIFSLFRAPSPGDVTPAIVLSFLWQPAFERVNHDVTSCSLESAACPIQPGSLYSQWLNSSLGLSEILLKSEDHLHLFTPPKKVSVASSANVVLFTFFRSSIAHFHAHARLLRGVGIGWCASLSVFNCVSDRFITPPYRVRQLMKENCRKTPEAKPPQTSGPTSSLAKFSSKVVSLRLAVSSRMIAQYSRRYNRSLSSVLCKAKPVQ